MAYLFKRLIIYEIMKLTVSVCRSKGNNSYRSCVEMNTPKKTQCLETIPLGDIFAAGPVGNLENSSVGALSEDFSAFVKNGFIGFQSL